MQLDRQIQPMRGEPPESCPPGDRIVWMAWTLARARRLYAAQGPRTGPERGFAWGLRSTLSAYDATTAGGPLDAPVH